MDVFSVEEPFANLGWCTVYYDITKNDVFVKLDHLENGGVLVLVIPPSSKIWASGPSRIMTLYGVNFIKNGIMKEFDIAHNLFRAWTIQKSSLDEEKRVCVMKFMNTIPMQYQREHDDAARKIQHIWRRVISCPYYNVCRSRLNREFYMLST